MWQLSALSLVGARAGAATAGVRRAAALVLVTMAVALPASARTLSASAVPSTVPVSAASPPASTAVPARTVTDALGRTVRVPESPARIVSTAPSITEILFALGLGPRVVGVSSADDYPPEQVRGKPRVGGVILDVERLMQLRPDLVLGMPSLQRAQLERLVAAGLPVVAVDARTLPDVYALIELIGWLTGTDPAAARLVSSLQAREAAVARAIRGRPTRRVYVEVWPEPLIAAAGGTFIDDLIRRAGGRNVFGGLRGYPQVAAEAVVRADPEVIIVTHPHGRTVGARPGWGTLSAVRSSRVAQVDGSLLSRPGPRAAAGLELLARVIHLEAFR